MGKTEKSKGLDILIYYWDDRDGEGLCGWGFGPNVGGEQVWAYHPSRPAATPPASEWNVPHDGEIDPTFSVTADPEATKKAEKSKKDKGKSEKDNASEKLLDSGAHAHFVNAYNKRREERLAAEAKDTPAKSKGDKPAEAASELTAEMQKLNEEEEEERRQMENL